jgi:glucuronoarabinoxylan endo-1,4-beta-xylanase
VDLNTTYQTMDGFGGMQDKGWTGYNLMSSDRDLLYGTGPGQIGLTIMRVRINDVQSAWSNDVVDAKDVVSRGLKVFATEWSPPSSMRVTSGSSYMLDPTQDQAYADYMNSFAKYMNTNGVPLYAMGFQNEPDWCSTWACGTPTAMYDFAKSYGPSLRANGNKVISAESFSFNKSYYDPILDDPTALANIDILGTHFYGTSKTSPDATFDYTLFKQNGAGHHFWMTEVYTAGVNNATSNTWPLCLDAAYEIHRAVALSNMSASSAATVRSTSRTTARAAPPRERSARSGTSWGSTPSTSGPEPSAWTRPATCRPTSGPRRSRRPTAWSWFP